MTSRRLLGTVALGAASVLALAGCAGSGSDADSSGASDDGVITVVASMNVYGDIAEAIGGDAIEVTSIIDSVSADPHEYEATASDKLAVSKGDLIIENGGGYDAFMDTLIDSSGTDAPVVTAVEFSHDWPGNGGHEHTDDADETHADDDHDGHGHVEGFNEHVWYDPHTIAHVAEEIAHQLGELDPANADTYEKNYEEFAQGIEGLEDSLEKIAAAHGGEQIFVTEPVPLYLTAAAGLENATPDAFSEAVEEGQDVPPATLLEATRILEGGTVRILFVNAQTGGPETDQVISVAKAQSIPVNEVSELLPEGETYLTWMQANIDAISASLAE